jgi:hypothetical protein
MAWTQEDIDKLKTAIASGVSEVSYAGPPARSIRYQSTDQMLDALAEMTAEVAAASGTGKTYRLAATRKGL